MPSLDPEMHQAGCRQLAFCFFKDDAKAQVCGLSLAHKFLLAFCTGSLAICQNVLSLLLLGMHTGSTRGEAHGVYVGEACVSTGGAAGLVEVILW